MNVLVIGGNGFLGTWLVEKLRQHGALVRVLDRVGQRSDFDWQGVDYRVGGLDEVSSLVDVLQGIDVVYHLASSTVPGTSNQDPVFDVSSNVIGSLRLIQAMSQADVRRIVFFSSGGTVYGVPHHLPVHESHPLHPISSYGVTKVAIENYLLMYQQLGAIDPLILRPSNPYGPRQSTAGIQGAVAAFLGRALRGEGIVIWGDGETIRDYIYVDDLAELAVSAGLGKVCGVFNAGSGQGLSLNELSQCVRQVTGYTLPAEYLPARGFDVPKVVLDIAAASSQFDWTPKVGMQEGLSRTWQALRRADK